MNDIIALINWQFIIGHILLSTYSICLMIYAEFRNSNCIKKREIIKYALPLFFLPGYNILVSLILTLFILVDIMFNIGEDYRGKEIEVKEKAAQEMRIKHVFGFLKYKGIEISELDNYIDSRNIMYKISDKIN